MSHIDHLIFDLDGTLIDSSEGVIDAVNYSLRREGLTEQSPERIKSFIGYPLEKMYAAFTDRPVTSFVPHFRQRAVETMVASTVVLEGVDLVLARLVAAGYSLAIATTKIRRHVDGIVAKFGWDEIFKVRVGADEVAQVKPAPDAFRLALERLGAESSRAMVIGDTENDILAAQAVPLPVAAIDSPYGGREKLKAVNPDYFLESISELPRLLKSINGEP